MTGPKITEEYFNRVKTLCVALLGEGADADSAVLRAAVLVYGLPLALFLIVCCLVWQITGNTLQTALAALGSLALGALLIKALDARFAPPLTITKATTRG